MFRTREWVMFVSGCAFVLGAIMVTGWSEVEPTAAIIPTASFATHTAVEEQQATVVLADDPSPSDALAAMREKVAVYRTTNNTNSDRFTVATSVSAVAGDATSSVADTPGSSPVQYCSPDATEYTDTWPRDAAVAEREGIRVVYVANEGAATGTVRLPETLLLQLPAPGRPGVTQRCLPNEVVGVAQDGSLIRNQEVGIYQIFSADTVVGYALDGFPIYGTNDSIDVDVCGGAMGPEGYGYVLQSERESIVQCFRGQPAQL